MKVCKPYNRPDHGLLARRLRQPLEWTVFILLLGLGIVFRTDNLSSPPLWVDEAESSINGLSILDHGVPVDHYLGIPVYENTLLRPWPNHQEYEFKDSSYSDVGVAIYHGWLPLYAIAGSFWLFGILPDQPGNGEPFPRTLEQMQTRTAAARLPSIVFSVLFLILIFMLGDAAFGRDVAWAALVAAVFSDSLIWLGSQARYYSATLALNAAVCLILIRLIRQGTRSDYLVASVLYILLFHTHTLSFLVACVVLALMMPFMFHHPHSIRHALVFGVIGVSGTAPWLWATGYFDHLGEIPRAWPLLELPVDILVYPILKQDYILLYGVGGLWLVFSGYVLSSKRSILTAFGNEGRPLLIISLWLIVSFVAYLFLTPAPSFFFNRLSIALLVPGLILGAVIFAAFARTFTQDKAIVLAPLLFLVFLVVAGRTTFTDQLPVHEEHYAPITTLHHLNLSDAARFYSTPNDHLVLSFYTGIPFQSVAPVRQKFLESYQHEIILVERLYVEVKEEDTISPSNLIETARKNNYSLNEVEAQKLSDTLSNRLHREELVQQGIRVIPPLRNLPPFVKQSLHTYKQEMLKRQLTWAKKEAMSPIFHGFTVKNWQNWWQIFFYRFVDPEIRRGKGLNYQTRFADAEVYLQPGSLWKISLSRKPVPRGTIPRVQAKTTPRKIRPHDHTSREKIHNSNTYKGFSFHAIS